MGLSETFKIASPGVKYSAEHARRKLLQLPFVYSYRQPCEGASILNPNRMDYSKLGIIKNSLVLNQTAMKGGTLE